MFWRIFCSNVAPQSEQCSLLWLVGAQSQEWKSASPSSIPRQFPHVRAHWWAHEQWMELALLLAPPVTTKSRGAYVTASISLRGSGVRGALQNGLPFLAFHWNRQLFMSALWLRNDSPLALKSPHHVRDGHLILEIWATCVGCVAVDEPGGTSVVERARGRSN